MDGLAGNSVTVGAESLHCADELLTFTVGFKKKPTEVIAALYHICFACGRP